MLIIDTFVSYVRMNIICSIFNDVRFDQKRKREILKYLFLVIQLFEVEINDLYVALIDHEGCLSMLSLCYVVCCVWPRLRSSIFFRFYSFEILYVLRI